MKILRINEAKNAIGKKSLYLSTMNDINIKIRGGKSLKDLIKIRKKAVINLFSIENYEYYIALQSQINKYAIIKNYDQYIKDTGVILSDGSDERNASHCHNNNIIISVTMIKDLDYIFAHELWHIISRNINSLRRNIIYKSFDIFPCKIKIIVKKSDKYIPATSLSFLQNPDNHVQINKKSILAHSFKLSVGSIVILPLIKNTMFGSILVGKLVGSYLYELTGPDKKYIIQLLNKKYKTNYLIGADEVVAEIFSNKIYNNFLLDI